MVFGRDGRPSPEAAFAEIERTGRQVRRRGRWPGLVWLGIAGVLFGSFVLSGSGDQLLIEIVGPILLLAALAVYLVAARQPVVSDRYRQKGLPLSYAYLGAVAVATVIKLTVLPQHFTAWLVVLGALMSVPALVAAWRSLCS
jgi:hypothetical protein